MNGPTPVGQPDLLDRLTENAAESPWFQWVSEAERNGILEDVLGHLDFNILSTLKLNGFVRHEIISDIWIEAYRAPIPNLEEAVGAIGWAKGFATGQHKFEQPDETAKLAIQRKPALAIWGDEDRTLNAGHLLALFSQVFPNAPVHRLSNAGHYSPEDAPDDVARIVANFLNKPTKN